MELCPSGCSDEKGRIVPELIKARERGVIVDLGHGMASFSFKTAKEMVKQRFFPDTIGSDIHILSINGPVFDLPTTMSKMLNLGMSLNEVVRATTYKPALVLGEDDEIGHLKPGSIADIAVLELREGKFEFIDRIGSKWFDLAKDKIVGNKSLFPVMTIKGGKLFKASPSY